MAVALVANDVSAGNGPDRGERLRLSYDVPQECPRVADFRDRVVSLVRTPPGAWRNDVEVRVVIMRRDRGYVGRVGVVQHDERDRSPSERELRASTCSPVVAALAVSAALAIDDALEASAGSASETTFAPHADEPPEAPPILSTAEPAPASAHRAVPAPAAPKAHPLELRLGGASAVRWGVAPDPAWMQTASFAVGWHEALWPPTLRAEVGFGATPIVRTEYGAFRTRLFEAALSTCTPDGAGWLAYFDLCVGASGGVLASTSFEVLRPTDRIRPWFTAFAAPHVRLPITAGLAVVAEGRIAFPFVRETLTFYPGIVVYEAPSTVFQAALGLEVTLPVPRHGASLP